MPKVRPEAIAPAQYTMKTLDQVRILAHPLRLRLLEAFATAPSTTHQVAKALGLPATRLYHHVNALEKVGLIRLKETRPVRGTVEKYYEAVARRMVVGAGLFSQTKGLNDVLSSVLDEARRDLVEAMGRMGSTPEGLRPLALRAILNASPARVAKLRANLLAELQKRPGGKGARATITLVFAAEAVEKPAKKP